MTIQQQAEEKYPFEEERPFSRPADIGKSKARVLALRAAYLAGAASQTTGGAWVRWVTDGSLPKKLQWYYCKIQEGKDKTYKKQVCFLLDKWDLSDYEKNTKVIAWLYDPESPASPSVSLPENVEKENTIRAYGLTTRVWTEHEKYGYGCSECCNGDRCDEDCTAVYKRKDCPHCKGKGWIPKSDVEEKDKRIS